MAPPSPSLLFSAANKAHLHSVLALHGRLQRLSAKEREAARLLHKARVAPLHEHIVAVKLDLTKLDYMELVQLQAHRWEGVGRARMCGWVGDGDCSPDQPGAAQIGPLRTTPCDCIQLVLRAQARPGSQGACAHASRQSKYGNRCAHANKMRAGKAHSQGPS